MPRPRKRYTAKAVPSGAPIAKAQTLAVRLTCSDSRDDLAQLDIKPPDQRNRDMKGGGKVIHAQAIKHFTAKWIPVSG